jgi:hypothetical protein
MNAKDILMYGHRWVHKHLDGFSEQQWIEPGVCGVWSVKEIVAHLTSFEWVLVEVFRDCIEPTMTPTLNLFTSMDGDAFNAVQVDLRKAKSPAQVLEEYNQAYELTRDLIPRLDGKTLTQPGTLPWYGEEYSLDDFIVYQYYGHKREHCAQIAIYRDRVFG